MRDVRKAVADMAAHDHRQKPGNMGDLFCLNLSSWIGERGRSLLEHIDALEAEIVALKKNDTPSAEKRR